LGIDGNHPILSFVLRISGAALLLLVVVGCGGEGQPRGPEDPAGASSFLLVTIDTLRADRVGAYGDASARTPAMDGLAGRGVRFTSAFAVAPITLPSHASIMTGRYPAGHGARHNGMRVDPDVPTLADALSRAGFATGAFVGAFPLDRRFGLSTGFEAYGDRMPRGRDHRQANEREGRLVVDEAIGWLHAHRGQRFFLWVHLFEPHAPYGDAGAGGTVEARYGEEVAEADRQVARLLEALGPGLDSTIVAVTSDHGEAFGEHGELAHSVFIYDTTLRVPLLLAGPGLPRRVVDVPVSLVDLAPTAMRLLGRQPLDTDGVDLAAVIAGSPPAAERTIYAESFAPLLDFGWSPLRAARAGGWKYIAAPGPELYHVAADPGESRNLAAAEGERVTTLSRLVDRYPSAQLNPSTTPDRDAAARLQALGYVSGGAAGASRPDPKDRRDVAARIAQVTSGELQGEALERVLMKILETDPRNPLANLRLGYLLLESDRCRDAMPKFQAAIEGSYPSADPHLGLAACQAEVRRFAAAVSTLRAADALEPGNPVVLANLGLMLSDGGDPRAAVDPLRRALTIDPDLHHARFGLAVAFARAGQRDEAAGEAQELLRRLPPDAPQRGEVQRLLAAVR
jgi:arylsulfatase A-like enzyme